ncbi:hypothetical protein KIN20_028468 [Parelaphostrongylus tenuis]|uniref:tRNA (34-2'-O)-methyltransferase regulator WDR6 n=1 Tax=Parelaphostrongylus tenuis TaxID=148309 RepID=A0AAD5WF29_PARTN|nr:hypothetical protein KIN20_028468 [Parelaphostrongylus tenuis]
MFEIEAEESMYLGGVFVLGQRSVAYVTDERLLGDVANGHSTSWVFFDQPIDITPLDEKNEVAVLFGTSLLALYRYELSPFKMHILKHVRSERYALTTSCVLLGSSWSALTVIAGTMDGEILVSVPSSGSTIRTVLECHRGMVFDIIRWNEFLYSVADDRSLAVWDASNLTNSNQFIDNISSNHKSELDVRYGHSSRPYCVCTDNDGHIYTAGNDETVCVWSYVDGRLKMIYQRNIRCGPIRALHIMDRKLFVACESGALVTIPIDELCEHIEFQNHPWQNVRDFVRVHDVIYRVDENNGDGQKNFARFLSRSPLYATDALIMTYVWEKSCHFFMDNNGSQYWEYFNSVILSVNICGIYALIYCVDRIGRLLDVTRRTVVATLNFDDALNYHSIKSVMRISTIAVTSIGAKMFITVGTVSGHLFYTDFIPFSSNVLMDSSYQINKHFGRKVINQLKVQDDDIFALGGNGILAHFKVCDDGLLHVIAVGLACPWLHGFTPSSFSTSDDLILGFQGTCFHVVDLRLRDSVGIVPCGGSNRHWSFSLQSNYDVLQKGEIRKRRGRFEFLRNGVIVCVDLYLEHLHFLVPRVHRKEIIDICTIFDTEESSYVATVGSDHLLQIAEIGPQHCTTLEPTCYETFLPLFNSFAPTCVCTSVSPKSLQIVVGGEKGSVVMWIIVEPNTFMIGDSCDIRPISYKRPHSSARVMDIAVTSGKFTVSNVHRCECCCAVAYGDGTIEFLTVTDHEGIGDLSFQKMFSFGLRSFEGYENSDYSIFTKLVSWVSNDTIYFYAASTSGKLCTWKASSDCIPQFLSSTLVENCGLSALTPEITEDTTGHLAVGTDSGRITIFSVFDEDVGKLATIEYHAATVNGIVLKLKQSHLELVSLAQDCILAIHLIDIASKDVRCICAVPLDVFDPRSLVVTRYGAVVVGNGLQVIPYAEWLQCESSGSKSHP